MTVRYEGRARRLRLDLRPLCGEELEQVGAREDRDGLPGAARRRRRSEPGSSANTSSTDARASTDASGGCIATATSSFSASGFRNTRSSRLRSWIEPTMSVSVVGGLVAHDRQLRDAVALHQLDRGADLLVRVDDDEVGHRVVLVAA